MIYGIIRCELDEFSGMGTRWIADPESLRVFRSRYRRDRVLDELEDSCECYESYVAVDREEEDFPPHPRGRDGRFTKKKDTGYES